MHFSICFIILTAITALLYFALMELSKSRPTGKLLALAVFCAFFALYGAFLYNKSLPVRIGAWLAFLAALFAVLKLFEPRPVRLSPVRCKDPEKAPVIELKTGRIRGIMSEDGAVSVYAGIPYAKPPVGELRWREPQSAEPWSGILECALFAPKSMQKKAWTLKDSLSHLIVYNDYFQKFRHIPVEAMSEDSLYLNVWKPSGKVKNAPVLVYIHGGSLTGGDTSFYAFNGESLARRGIVFISIDYRVGIFGYLTAAPLARENERGAAGNYGLLDQIHALKWIRENIASFGGDPDNVTICGESAGASSVNALCCSPLAKGLFRRAVAESSAIVMRSPYHSLIGYKKALSIGEAIMKKLGVSTAEELRSLPAEKLLKYHELCCAMTIDGYALIEPPYRTYERGANNEEALMHGFNAHEVDPFVLTHKVTTSNYEKMLLPILGEFSAEATRLFPPAKRDRAYAYFIDAGGNAKGSFNRVYSAAWFAYGHRCWSRLLSRQGIPVFEYLFSKDNGSLGSLHSGELPYIYGNLPNDKRNYDAGDHALSALMTGYLVNFVKTGDPNGDGLPIWNDFSEDPASIYEFGEKTGHTADPFLDLYELLDRYQKAQAEEQA